MLSTLWELAKRTAREYADDNCSHMAAAISYYVLFSILPLTIFLVSIFGLVVRDADLQEDVADEIVDVLNVERGVPVIEFDAEAIDEAFGAGAAVEVETQLAALPDTQTENVAARLDAGEMVTVGGFALGPDELTVRSDNAIIDTIRGVSDVSGALTIVGLVGMLWSASAMFGAIRKSLNIAWDVETFRPVVRQKLIDLGMVLGIGLLLGLSIAGTGALRTLRELSDDALGPLSSGTGFFWALVPFVLPAVFSLAVFMLLYRYVPSVQHTVMDVLPGALFATVLFEALKNAFAIYVANFNSYAGAYGALGGILLFLLWMYLTANILLVGAEVASEYERLQRGEAAPSAAPAGPKLSAYEQVRRFLRGLVFHEHEMRGESSRDDGPPSS